MKKALLTTLGVAALGMASYAATFMQVETKDGEKFVYEVEDVSEVIFFEKESVPSDTTPASSHAYVDLGLPSGTLWATYNIGATKPEEYGDYFAWGETTSKKVYDWSTYKHAKASVAWHLDSLTKYNFGQDSPGVIDSLATLLSDDDAATANWGKDWRMPTNEEQQELINNCQYEWTKVNGVKGAKFTASNGNFIFLPVAGFRDGSNVYGVGNRGYYWSSSLLEGNENAARHLEFDDGEATSFRSDRIFGFPVRAVRAEKAERKTYSVKFYTSDSTLIESQNVVEGMSAKEVKAPEKNGYDFVGWSAATDSVVSNMSVYALYKKTPASSHAYVDLGLPSGTLWATYNIGATKPEEYGDYFAWGETAPKEVYSWNRYKYAITKNGSLDSLTKYNSGNSGYPGVIDGQTTLLAEDDAATANWGSDWRMPTTEQQHELYNNCQWEWTETNGVSGAKFTGANGNSIFLPAAGLRSGSDLKQVGSTGDYWSSSLNEESEFNACILGFQEREAHCDNGRRSGGFSVRAVRAKK